MFKNHPKGLLAAALSNMGERFGFYTMMAILLLFLMAKFGLSETTAGVIYSIFYAMTYVLALVGGTIADKTKKFKETIMTGILLMALGYLMIAIPTGTPIPQDKYVLLLALACLGLFIVAFGNGLFKGNLQAMVGQMYDSPQYAKMRDSGFLLFYMFINIGAFFAPILAVLMRNWWLSSHHFAYVAELPEVCHSFLNGTLSSDGIAQFQAQVTKMGYTGTDLTTFAHEYLNIFNEGFHYAFGIAVVMMMVSFVIYVINKKRFPSPQTATQRQEVNVQMEAKEIKQRIYAIFAVLSVVIFFWFSFHQNGVTLTAFAKNYTDLSSIDINLGFTRFVGVELFQSINPFFVVTLTPLVLYIFGAMRKRGKEPSTPKKIAIGMGIAALAYIIMAVFSMGLPMLKEVKAMGILPDDQKVTPLLLVGTYFVLTVAELLISPLGISFVSKVAPPQYQGIMQGMWLSATAIGNLFLFVGMIFYRNLTISMTWIMFVIVCLISMSIMLSMLKWLEKVSGK